MFFFCKQKTADEMRSSDWSSDVCSSDLEMEFGVVKACIEQAIELVLECVGPLQELQGPIRPTGVRSSKWSRLESRYAAPACGHALRRDRKSVGAGKSVSVRVDLGGRRIINNKNC